jgi:hypothetical protein
LELLKKVLDAHCGLQRSSRPGDAAVDAEVVPLRHFDPVAELASALVRRRRVEDRRGVRQERGDLPGGLALNDASRLSFWARSDREGLMVRFGYGLLLRDVTFFDTSRQGQVLRLTRTWTRYEFDLRGQNLDRIKVGFFFSMESPGPGGPHHFYLDDIRYE